MPPLPYYYTQHNNEHIVDPNNAIKVQHTGVVVEWTKPDQWLNGQRQEFGVRGMDGKNVTLRGLRLENFGNGVFLTNSNSVLEDVQVKKTGGEGIQVGGSQMRARLIRCGAFDLGWEWQQSGNPRNCAHALYLDGRGTGWADDDLGIYAEECFGFGCNGMGLHYRGWYHIYSKCDWKDNRPGNDNSGAGNVQGDNAHHVLFDQCFTENGDSGHTVYTDQGACEDIVWKNGAIWQPTDHFATSCYVIPLVVSGGFLCGGLAGIRPRLENGAEHFPEGDGDAQTALAAWLATYRGTTPPVEPPVEPPIEPPSTEEVDRLKAQMAQAQATLAEAGEMNRQVGTLLSRAWNELEV